MFEITMPQAGQTMEDGTVVRWLKKEGQEVKAGEILLEIETDKATIEVESAHSGTLRKILVPEGQTVAIHTPIALIGGANEAIAAAQAPAPAASAPPAAPTKAAPAAPAAASVAVPTNVIPVLMPKAGQSMEEGTIVAWRVKPGDRIKQGDIIFEVETDKANVEIEATDSGRLARIVLEAGQTLPVLQPVAFLAENDADVDAFLAAGGLAAAAPASAAAEAPAAQAAPAVSSAPAPAAPVKPAAVSETGRIKASPAARKVASERGVDLASVGQGKGPGGRILSTDVPLTAAAAPAPLAAPGTSTRRKLSPMRKAIAKNLLASKQNIPHFYMRLTIDAQPLMDHYRAQKAQYACSLNDFIIAGCAKAIREFPAFRSRIDKDELVELPTANIGVAVGMDDGLVVPVVMAADCLTLRQLAAETKRVVEAARGGKVEGMGKGVFTISNLGMFGVEEFSAIINPPESAIMAVSAMRETVIVRDGAMRPGKVMTMTLSCDHRVIDGLLAAKFMARLKEILEAPAQLV